MLRGGRKGRWGNAWGNMRSVALSAIREGVRRIAAAHGAGNVRVFGSVGRGEQDASTDLDLLVDMAKVAACST